MLAMTEDRSSISLEGISSVLLKFIFIKHELVSKWLWRQPLPENQKTVGYEKPGAKIILPTLCVGMHAFLHELKDAGFELADAFVDDRPDGKHVASFVFKRLPILEAWNESHRMILDDHATPSLLRLCKGAGWQLCGFRNQLSDGAGLSLNCNARVDTKATGQPPQKYLRILDGALILE